VGAAVGLLVVVVAAAAVAAELADVDSCCHGKLATV